ncbi:MAG: Gfo/Idh/MocA family oxidoreductase [Methylococcaceae bacterium]|jgi:predicted dehydrogenase
MVNKTEAFKLGFIGGGLASAIGQTHYSASRLDGNWDVVSGAFSRNVETNLATAAEWRIDPKRTYIDWRVFIEQEKNLLDAVVVLTPTPDHEEVLCALLQENIPVICEKAFVSSLKQLDRVKHVYNPDKHFLAVTYNYSGYPMVRELQDKIKAGELGNIQQIHLEMPQEGFVRPPDIAGKAAGPQSWRLQDGIIPTICLDLGVHLHHLMVFLLNEEASEVMAELDHYSSYDGVIDNVKMWLRFKTPKTASFWMTKTAIGSRNGLKLRVYGDQGSAEWVQILPEELSFSNINGIHTKIDRGSKTGVSSLGRYNRMKVGHPAGFIEAFANLYQDFFDALTEWKATGKHTNPYVFGLEHSANGLNLFHSARTSDQEKKWVTLN